MKYICWLNIQKAFTGEYWNACPSIQDARCLKVKGGPCHVSTYPSVEPHSRTDITCYKWTHQLTAVQNHLTSLQVEIIKHTFLLLTFSRTHLLFPKHWRYIPPWTSVSNKIFLHSRRTLAATACLYLFPLYLSPLQYRLFVFTSLFSLFLAIATSFGGLCFCILST